MFSYIKQLKKSFSYAWQGIVYVHKHEHNFQFQILVGCLVLLAGMVVSMARWEMIVLLGMIMLVLILEVLNSVFEKMLDVLKPRLTYQVKIIKDMLAAMVLLAAIFSIIIGSILFYPYMFELLV
ncbi:MAG: diacylglycerol kinase family protein [Candidatus Magasanikbacteria bacterium]|jgi:diacylglycerol kinase|nr:diacylglycerol kinase family protein [Candidatus Magasanikbacteria bacterium]